MGDRILPGKLLVFLHLLALMGATQAWAINPTLVHALGMGGLYRYGYDAPTDGACPTEGAPPLPLRNLHCSGDITRLAPGYQPSFESCRAAMHFESQGFHCSVLSLEQGMTCVGRVPGYPEDVAFIIPPDYRPEPGADVLLHLHGHATATSTLEGVLGKYEFASRLHATGRNSIMVVPFSRGKCATYEQQFAAPHFDQFMASVHGLIGGAGLSPPEGMGPLTISAHSGAYRALGHILDDPCATEPDHGCAGPLTREVYLFDTVYTGHNNEAINSISHWANHGNRRLGSVFQSHTQTAEGNEAVWRNTSDFNNTTFAGDSLPADASDQQVADTFSHSNVVFMRSNVGHVDTVSKYWTMMLSRTGPHAARDASKNQ